MVQKNGRGYFKLKVKYFLPFCIFLFILAVLIRAIECCFNFRDIGKFNYYALYLNWNLIRNIDFDTHPSMGHFYYGQRAHFNISMQIIFSPIH